MLATQTNASMIQRLLGDVEDGAESTQICGLSPSMGGVVTLMYTAMDWKRIWIGQSDQSSLGIPRRGYPPLPTLAPSEFGLLVISREGTSKRRDRQRAHQ